MILKMYSVRDIKAAVYGQPFYQHTHGEAERTFKRLANDEKTNICQFPADFELYYMGQYDDNSGEILPEKPQFVQSAMAVRDVKQSVENKQ